MTVNVPCAPPPASRLGLASFHLGIQEVLHKCILDRRAAGTIRGFSWAPEHRSRQGISRPLAGCLSHSILLSHTIRQCKVPPSHHSTVVQGVGPHSLGPNPSSV